ncbi:MAG TPA: hypothetical protein VIH21_07895 [Dehalococcoidia bacterium]|jgi:hypothetical protein
MTHLRRLSICVAVVLVLSMSACKIGRDKNEGSTPETLGEGQSLGKIDRLPGGTPVATDVRTLLTLECATDTLVLRTNIEALTAAMPCDRMLPSAVIEQFLGKPVAITYENARLKVANETVGTIELPSDEPRITAIDATP